MPNIANIFIVLYTVKLSNITENSNVNAHIYQNSGINQNGSVNVFENPELLNGQNAIVSEVGSQPRNDDSRTSRKRSYVNEQAPKKSNERLSSLDTLLNIFDYISENRPVRILKIGDAELNDCKNQTISEYFNKLRVKLKELRVNYSKHYNNKTKVLKRENTSVIKQEFDEIPYNDDTKGMSQLNDILEELNRRANDRKLINVMALSQLLKTYLVCTNKHSSEVLNKINIKEIRTFYIECKKYTRDNMFCHCRNAYSKLIDDLLVKLLGMLFKKRIVKKFLLFPEFSNLNQAFTKFFSSQHKMNLSTKLFLIYLINRTELLFTKCILLKQGEKNLRNEEHDDHCKTMLQYRFLIREVFCTLLYEIFNTNLTIITKHVYVAEIEYCCMIVGKKTGNTLHITKKSYEILFFMSYELFDRLRFSGNNQIYSWDIIETLKCLEDNIVVRKIIEYQNQNVKSAFKRSIENMCTYLNNSLPVEHLINMSEIFDYVDKWNGRVNHWINGFIVIYQNIYVRLETAAQDEQSKA